MGATTFHNLQPGADPDKAFAEAVAAAAAEYGDGECTGTIASKDGYVIVADKPMTPEAADKLAGQLLDDEDERVDDKWGPAGAIPVADPRVRVQIEIPPGVYDTDRAAIDAAVKAHGFGGAKPSHVPHTLYGMPEESKYREYLGSGDYGSAAYAPRPGANRFRILPGATIEVEITQPAAGLNAWLFFGWAAT